ncbi:MAG: 30S ribosomal protein S20 [Actinobacteria bacterium]|nr:30S ribosomal protein S20 [Actinomycetota bacterium]
MANIKSQIKRIGTSEKQRLANKAVKTRIKSEIKKFYYNIEAGELQKASEDYSKISSLLDRAASKRVIHPNNASNKKSSLSKNLSEKIAREKSA